MITLLNVASDRHSVEIQSELCGHPLTSENVEWTVNGKPWSAHSETEKASLPFCFLYSIPFSMPGQDRLKPPGVRESVPLSLRPEPASISIRPARRHPCLARRKAEPR